MQSFVRTLALGSVLAILSPAGRLTAQSTVQSIDAGIGTWTLNVAKSTFSPGPAPKSITLTIETVEQGIKFDAKGVGADGAAFETVYTGNVDGKDYPATGSLDYDVVSMKQIDAWTRETTRKMGGKVVQTVRSVFTKNGKMFTSTTKGSNAKGQAVDNVTVYDKQ
jgi:hypothetical protein